MIQVDINAPGIAVICNAWTELNKDIHQHCFQTTLDTIDSNPAISTVLLAGTHVRLATDTQGPNQWVDNSRKIFVEEQGVDWVRRFWNQHASHESFHINPLIRDHNYGGKLCLAIWEQWELEYLLNHRLTRESNIWYFGSGLGVRRDPFGWAQLCDLIKYKHVRPLNILTHRHGMINNCCNSSKWEDCDFEYVEWEKLSDWANVDNDFVVKTSLEW
jgi:hypothetical protein